MESQRIRLHLIAGRLAGELATCGKKVDYKSEATAAKSAKAMMAKGSKPLEEYPCYFCHGWHIGRKMEEAELLEWERKANTNSDT